MRWCPTSYNIETDNDVYKDIKGNEWFDFSNYVEVHNNFDDSKELTPGFFKDDFAGRFLLEFVGLRAKEGDKKATVKGINKNVKDEVLTHEDYKNSLLKRLQMSNKMTRIMQENHKLYTVEVEKKSLSPFNDKKWVSRDVDDFKRYSFGHYKKK